MIRQYKQRRHANMCLLILNANFNNYFPEREDKYGYDETYYDHISPNLFDEITLKNESSSILMFNTYRELRMIGW